MPTKSSQQHSLCIAVALLLLTHPSWAESDFSFFSSPELNYWKDASQTATTPAATPRLQKPPARQGSFQWQKYLDPKSDEFFREGDYSPPAPFMEIARDPSDTNIENWFHYLEMKNQLLHRLQDKLTAYAASHPQNGVGTPPEFVATASSLPSGLSAPPVNQPAPLSEDSKHFRLRLYFDSHCPHCEHMLGTTIRDLAGLGYWIELRQVDGDASVRARIPYPVARASPEELRRYGVESVPVLLVGNLKTHSYFKIQGDQTTQAVLVAMKGQRRDP